MIELDSLLATLNANPGAELVLADGKAPALLEGETLNELGLPQLSADWMRGTASDVLGDARREDFVAGRRLAFAYSVPGVGTYDVVASGGVDRPELRFTNQWDRASQRMEALSADHIRAAQMSDPLKDTLKLAVKVGASDIHLGDEDPPMARVKGDLVELDCPARGRKVLPMVESLLNRAGRRALADGGAVDFSFTVDGVGRFRGNAYRSLYGHNLAIRTLPEEIPSLRDLRLPKTLAELVNHRDGLVLFTGPTGAGKSATMAALVAHINKTRPVHVITLEDPIEFVHRRQRAIVRQREVGVHCESFADGLRDALREDPDVILLGEMRDLETMSLAITAAETGHLVLSTLHANRAHAAVDRMIDVFPEARQAQVRLQLADVLRAVVTQRLLPMADGSGRIAALEVLRSNHAVANHIRDQRTHQIPSIMQTHREAGMWMLERHLASMVRKKHITMDTALAHTSDQELLESYLRA